MTSDVAAGINEQSLGALSEEISVRVDRISDVLERINRSIDRLPEAYQGEPCDKLMQRYGEMRASFPMLKENLVSYAADLKALAVKMHEGDQSLSSIIQEATNDARAQLKVVQSKYNVDNIDK